VEVMCAAGPSIYQPALSGVSSRSSWSSVREKGKDRPRWARKEEGAGGGVAAVAAEELECAAGELMAETEAGEADKVQWWKKVMQQSSRNLRPINSDARECEDRAGWQGQCMRCPPRSNWQQLRRGKLHNCFAVWE